MSSKWGNMVTLVFSNTEQGGDPQTNILTLSSRNRGGVGCLPCSQNTHWNWGEQSSLCLQRITGVIPWPDGNLLRATSGCWGGLWTHLVYIEVNPDRITPLQKRLYLWRHHCSEKLGVSYSLAQVKQGDGISENRKCLSLQTCGYLVK